MRLLHYSCALNLARLEPSYHGRGQATREDRRGRDRVYFYVEGSALGADAPLLGLASQHCYHAEIPDAGVYDVLALNDPLRWLHIADREAADNAVVDAGYTALRVSQTADGRDVVISFVPVAVNAV